mmetsp:Transcript_24477/g.30062  ORF Transcript_24477/g.30062 Transcript_24477/m.30062 type:complete len:88 (-) Transcript_24477:34-297(-)
MGMSMREAMSFKSPFDFPPGSIRRNLELSKVVQSENQKVIKSRHCMHFKRGTFFSRRRRLSSIQCFCDSCSHIKGRRKGLGGGEKNH